MEGNAYCVLPGRLMAGAYPGSPDGPATEARLAGLIRGGVRVFIDLTDAGEVTPLGPLRPHLPATGRRGPSVAFAPRAWVA